MASRFWVGGTGTWDASDTTHWAATTGGAGGASAPVAGDAVTFDASSGGGTVTPDSSIDSIAFLSITAGAFTGTLAFNTNNPNMAFTSFVNFSGTGARTINMGSGTWTLSGTSNNPAPFESGTVTNLTATYSNASIVYSGNSAFRTFSGGGQTYGSLTFNNNSTKGFINWSAAANTFASITVGSGNTLLLAQGVTQTITGALNITGTSSAPSGVHSQAPQTNAATVSVGSASTAVWASFLRVTKTGAGSITATDSFDLGGNTSITITGPSGGGSSGGQRVISG